MATVKKGIPPPRKGPAADAQRTKTPPRSEAQVDEALDETFPASDPPAHSTPTRPGPHRPAGR